MHFSKLVKLNVTLKKPIISKIIINLFCTHRMKNNCSVNLSFGIDYNK